MLRTTYTTPVQDKAGIEVKSYLEPTLVLCKEDLMITTAQLLYSTENKHVATRIHSTVYPNPGWHGQIVNEVIKWGCSGFSQVPAPKQKDTAPRQPAGTSV